MYFSGIDPTAFLRIEAIKAVSAKERSGPEMVLTVEEQIRLLSMVDLFGPLSEQEREELAHRMPDTYLERGDTLYSPHESSERLFILKKGRVQIYEVTEDGQEITRRSPSPSWKRVMSSGRWYSPLRASKGCT